MKEKELTYKDVPVDYPLCFNCNCAKQTCCMHYQASLLLPEGRLHGPAVYPKAWQNSECRYFREKRLVQKAWGFNHLYDNVPKQEKSKARNNVRCYFSAGYGPYYRYHHGERLLTPEQQDDILKIIAKCGATDALRFDHYVEAWDFG